MRTSPAELGAWRAAASEMTHAHAPPLSGVGRTMAHPTLGPSASQHACLPAAVFPPPLPSSSPLLLAWHGWRMAAARPCRSAARESHCMYGIVCRPAVQVGASNELPESEELDALYDRCVRNGAVKPYGLPCNVCHWHTVGRAICVLCSLARAHPPCKNKLVQSMRVSA